MRQLSAAARRMAVIWRPLAPLVRSAYEACQGIACALQHSSSPPSQQQAFPHVRCQQEASRGREPRFFSTDATPSAGAAGHLDTSSSSLDQPSSSQVAPAREKARILFLGSPEFVVCVLRGLVHASQAPSAQFEVVGVVSKGVIPKDASAPFSLAASTSTLSSTRALATLSRAWLDHTSGVHTGYGVQTASGRAGACWRRRGLPAGTWRRLLSAAANKRRQKGVTPLVAEALALGIPRENILCPEKAKDESFLAAVAALRPDLCVTAAYGNILPQRFLDIPRLGTVNIHPSLLPKYRGAAPVIRAIMDGVSHTGVSLAMTVLKCDAGPIVAQETVKIDPDEHASELTERLFQLGTKMLLGRLPGLLLGRAQERAVPQRDEDATHAAKVSKEDGWLDLTQPAWLLHNQVRALAEDPGTRVTFWVEKPPKGPDVKDKPARQPVDIRILRTRVITSREDLTSITTKKQMRGGKAGGLGTMPYLIALKHAPTLGKGQERVSLDRWPTPLPAHQVALLGNHAVVPCGQGTWLELVEVRYASDIGKGGGRGGGCTKASQSAQSGAAFMLNLARQGLSLYTRQQT